MNDHRMFSDNPNYFDEEVAANSVDASDRSFLLFMKRNSVDKPAKQEEQKQVPVRKRLACSKFLRYRSNSTTSSQMKSCVYTTPQYYNDISIKNHIENDSSFAQKESNIKVADVKQRHTPRNGQRTTICNDSLIPETRRHSIGTIDLKECLKKQVISDEVPEMMAPKAPIDLYKEGAHSLSTMDDILFVTARHNEQAFMWANHLKTCFDKITKQRGKIPFNFLHVRIDENQVNQQLVQRSLSTKLQVIIVCPVMLTLSTQYLHSTLVSILKPEQVLGLLLNVTEICAFENHKDTFPGYNKWRTCVAGDHEQSFLSELLGIATDILGCALRQQPHCYDPNVASLYKPSSPTGLHDMFTLFPRKVKIGQNKILAIFAEPLVKNDWIKIKIEKNNEIIEITNIKRRNPYIIQFSIPDSCMEISMMVGVRLEKNNIDLGCRALKCESQFRELEQILRTQNSPMEFLCQATGIAISDRDKLDSHLLQAFQKNVPTNFHLLNYADSEKKSKSHREASPEEYPTLLHFAAYWGLERLCLQLLECPGGDIACEMRNISARTPSDMADLGGHYKLADSIKNFSKMHEFTTMYHYFKGISDFSPNKIIIEPLSNCENSIPSSTPSSATLMVSGQLKQQQPNEGYMEMNASGSDAESISNDALNTVANLNYLIVDTVHSVMRHEVNLPVHTKEVEKNKEIMNNLNMNNDCSEHDTSRNELKMSEFQYADTNDIDKSDLFSQECSNLLEECSFPVNSDATYLLQPSNLPVENIDLERNYLIQPTNIPIHEHESSNYNSEYQQTASNKLNINRNTGTETSHLRLSCKKNQQNLESKPKIASLYRQERDNSKKSVDDELLEIISDFKNNVFTIQEVEQLVQAWKSRNDVQQSFKDKQEQLQKMRQEYERIQQQMKEKLKRPTPFETMRKIFTRSKNPDLKKEESSSFRSVCEDNKVLMSFSLHQSRRPMSSSSIHSISSNSSDRISTLSGASIGDSGTHSDSEEQSCGLATNSGNKMYKPNSSLDNYMIPPNPRPVLTTPTNLLVDKITHTSNTVTDEHYAVFPSNIPVNNDNSKQSANNYLALDSIDESKEISKPMQSITIQKYDINSHIDENRPLMTSFLSKKAVSDDPKEFQ